MGAEMEKRPVHMVLQTTTAKEGVSYRAVRELDREEGKRGRDSMLAMLSPLPHLLPPPPVIACHIGHGEMERRVGRAAVAYFLPSSAQ